MNMFKKFDSFRSKFSNQVKFSLLAAAMVLIIAGAVVYLSTFLITELNQGLQTQFAPPQALRFDIAGFKKLNLTK